MSFTSLLTQTCSTYRQGSTQDAMGGVARSVLETLTGVACRIQPLRGVERIMSNQIGAEITHKMFCDSCDITERDEVVDGDGVRYDVNAVLNIGNGHHLEVMMTERRPERTVSGD